MDDKKKQETLKKGEKLLAELEAMGLYKDKDKQKSKKDRAKKIKKSVKTRSPKRGGGGRTARMLEKIDG